MSTPDWTPEELQTLEAIEIYRAEHTTWNLDKLRRVFTDSPTVWIRDVPYEGKKGLESLLAKWSRPGRTMEMLHDRVVVRGNLAAVEWETKGTDEKGAPFQMAGANVYELENGRIKYLRIYPSWSD